MRRVLVAVLSIAGSSCGGSSQRPAPTMYAAVAPPAAPAPGPPPVGDREPARLARDCDAHDLAACTELAQRYLAARELDYEPARALALRTRACDGGHVEACGALAIQVFHGDGVEADEARGKQLYARACDAGHARACEGLAKADRDRASALLLRAFTLYLRACDAGDAAGCFAAHSLHRNQRHPGEVPAASWAALRTRAEASCARGQATGCATMSGFHGPFGVAVDPAAAATFAARGCELKDGALCGSLARAHETGEGVPKDAARAVALQLRACQLGDRYGCYFAANAEPDAGKRLALHRRGCDAGDINQCQSAVRALDTLDPTAAKPLRERTCRRGWVPSCLELAERLVAAKRPLDAVPWLDRACPHRDGLEACIELATLRRAACDRGATDECRTLDAFLAVQPLDRRIGIMHSCCADRPELATYPAGALLLFFDAVRRKDLAAVRAYVHPKRPLKVRLAWHDETDAGEETSTLRATTRTLGKLADVSTPPIESLTCEALTGDGAARCSAYGGGYGASFELLRERGRFYVTLVSESTH